MIQPTLSKHVQALEVELGTQLLDRTNAAGRSVPGWMTPGRGRARLRPDALEARRPCPLTASFGPGVVTRYNSPR
ncbi:MAG: LysR family transcriptional regulator [Candidatus Limnocylindrales bacterium]